MNCKHCSSLSLHGELCIGSCGPLEEMLTLLVLKGHCFFTAPPLSLTWEHSRLLYPVCTHVFDMGAHLPVFSCVYAWEHSRLPSPVCASIVNMGVSRPVFSCVYFCPWHGNPSAFLFLCVPLSLIWEYPGLPSTVCTPIPKMGSSQFVFFCVYTHS